MSTRVLNFDVIDVRFPTSCALDGSDAMNKDPDYSVAYVVVRTSGPEDGYGFVFTIGRARGGGGRYPCSSNHWSLASTWTKSLTTWGVSGLR